ncbi:hypothetical protein [Salinisphaera sp. G21_0]|uniref:hypothetical protein n=1 Tax=Salinisphaera sp. G21_0 TaxID=2821094 RepID=UPI001ADA9CAD|nr:hypothetical protein [Salinisphaera sp. G21_0]MBO9483792.1 hypothetical protein [Salinisphaera sp. G21_0]
MAINPEQLEAEANAELEAMMQVPADDADTPAPEIKEPATPEPANNPEPKPPAPADTDSGNWEERYKNLQAHTTKVNQEASDLRRQLGEMQQQLNQLQQSANTGTAKDVDLPEPDELDSVAQDFDELAPMIKRMKEQEALIKELKAQRDQEHQHREQASQQSFMAKIAEAHPDHAQVYQSPEFKGWIERLPGIDRNAVNAAFSNQGSAEDVIEVFNRYKQASGLGSKHDQAARESVPELRSRSQPQTRTAPKFTWSQIQKMDPAEYAQREKEIDEAIMRGEVQ